MAPKKKFVAHKRKSIYKRKFPALPKKKIANSTRIQRAYRDHLFRKKNPPKPKSKFGLTFANMHTSFGGKAPKYETRVNWNRDKYLPAQLRTAKKVLDKLPLPFDVTNKIMSYLVR